MCTVAGKAAATTGLRREGCKQPRGRTYKIEHVSILENSGTSATLQSRTQEVAWS